MTPDTFRLRFSASGLFDFASFAVAVFVVLALPLGSAAVPDPDPADDAEIVFVRQDCGPEESEMENCFESMVALSSSMNGWIWTTRQPTAADPLVVDIGLGTFGEFQCPNTQAGENDPRAGHVSIRGSGRGLTVLYGPAEEGSSKRGAYIRNCTSLSFSDLTIRGPNHAVEWGGAGDATWSNVDLETNEVPGPLSAAWLDTCSPVPASLLGEQSVHRFFGSRILSFGSTGFYARTVQSECGEIRFYGGDIELNFEQASTAYAGGGVFEGFGAILWLSHNAEFHAYGTSIFGRARVPLQSGASLRAVKVTSGAKLINHQPIFQIHGGIVALNSFTGDTDVIGIVLEDDGMQPADTHPVADTTGTAFVLRASGTGTATRIVTSGNSVARIPFLWQAGEDPPASATVDLVSQDGDDLFVETDCTDLGDCDSGGAGANESHLMVYDRECDTAGPWRDAITGRCRGDTGS